MASMLIDPTLQVSTIDPKTVTTTWLKIELEKRNVKYAKSSKKEKLIRLLGEAQSLLSGSADSGSVLNAGGALSVAVATESFWQGLHHWNEIAKLSSISKSFKSVLANTMAWKNVVMNMPIMLKQKALELALSIHGSAQEMYFARRKKFIQRQKMALLAKNVLEEHLHQQKLHESDEPGVCNCRNCRYNRILDFADEYN